MTDPTPLDFDHMTPIEFAVARVTRALEAFQGSGDVVADIQDMLTDLRHLCDKHNVAYHELSDVSYQNYLAELHGAKTTKGETK